MKKADRIKIFNKYNGKCAYCGEPLSRMEVDHIIPKAFFTNHVMNDFQIPDFLKHLSKYDFDHKDNLFPACGSCNRWKSAHSLEQFRREISHQIERLNKRVANYRMAKRYNQLKETESEIVFYFETIKKNNER